MPFITRQLRYLWLAPVAIAAEGLNAGIETAGLSLLSLYAMGEGWTEAGATRLISCLMFGAILLQLPIGWLSDRMDRRRLAIILGVFATAGALIWPLVIHDPWIAYPVLFFWGGVFVGIYTLMMAIVGSRFQGADLVGIYAVMGLVWGVGALLGPALAGYLDGPPAPRPADFRRVGHPRLHNLCSHKPQHGVMTVWDCGS